MPRAGSPQARVAASLAIGAEEAAQSHEGDRTPRDSL